MVGILADSWCCCSPYCFVSLSVGCGSLAWQGEGAGSGVKFENRFASSTQYIMLHISRGLHTLAWKELVHVLLSDSGSRLCRARIEPVRKLSRGSIPAITPTLRLQLGAPQRDASYVSSGAIRVLLDNSHLCIGGDDGAYPRKRRN